MALVTVQRSPSVAGSPQCSNSDSDTEEEDGSKIEKNCSECFFAGKGTALVLALKDIPQHVERRLSTDSTKSTNSTQSNSSDIQQHLQSMFNLLRHEETLKMAVKLESQRPNRTRYLVIVSRCCFRTLTTDRRNKTTRSNSTKGSQSGAPIGMCSMRQQSIDGVKVQPQSDTNLETCEKRPSATATTSRLSAKSEYDKSSASGDNKFGESIEESCLLGIDCNERATIGLVVPILADTTIHLDGDGGFSVAVYGKTHILKPVSVQAMWSALQTLHKVSQKARENNFYPGGPSHDWLAYYESRIESDQSCLNEWNAMDSLESRRPPSPDAIRNKPTEKEETESIIKMKLKEIMMSVDLDEVTSKYIRSRLEEHLDMDLGEYKSFIDEEMLIILGQMDAPTEIFDHVYLGSEWNASNLEELQKNGVRHILNVTREIDNFFPGMFDYFNVRVYDDEKTNLLKHWDNTFRYINRAKDEGSKVLVHCKMGVSRSASVVIAYAMKAYNWEFQQAMQHVKDRRSCIKPNKNFLNQLETYRGMLDAMKNKEKLQRSKSETNLKSTKDARLLPGSEPTPLIQALNQSKSKSTGHGVSSDGSVIEVSGGIVNVSSICSASDHKQRRLVRRSSSTSPKSIQSHTAIVMKQQSQSLENLTPERSIADEPKNVRFPGSNGENYSVTQNQVLHIQKNTLTAKMTPNSVKTIVSGLESNQERKTIDDRKILNLQFFRSVSADVNNSKVELLNDEAFRSNDVDDNKIAECLVWTSSSKIITQTSTIPTRPGLELVNITQPLRSSMRLRRDAPSCGIGDMFSSKLDKVFGRELVRHTRKTQSWAPSSGGIVIDGVSVASHSTNKPDIYSRQSSTSSLDSVSTVTNCDRLIGSRTRQRELPCRHSSWGSGDQRSSLPMRNSSWSAFDKNRNSFQLGSNPATAAAIIEGQIQELNKSNKTASVSASSFVDPKKAIEQQMGTVKRTKQKLEECTVLKKLCQENCDELSVAAEIESPKRSSCLYRSQSAAASTRARFPNRCNSDEIKTSSSGGPHRSHHARLSDSSKPSKSEVFSASAPESYTISDFENKNTLQQAIETIELRNQEVLEEQRISGNVQNLKKSFELKAGAQTTSIPVAGSKRGNLSLPSSPVAQHENHMETTTKQLETNTATNYLNSKANTLVTTYYSIDSSEVSESSEDRNVKGLVHKYQTTRANTISNSSLSSTSAMAETVTNTVNKSRPRSYYESRHFSNTEANSRFLKKPPHGYHESKPPPSPLRTNCITSSTSSHSPTMTESILTHQQRRVLQHGKTHPLARLSLPKQSFNTAAYNTM